MDEIVKQAMVKWPNVPDCYGWLGLDARGNWYMRDDRAQAQGSFSSGLVGAKGSLLVHAKLIEFIQRNYASDEDGQWYFQNGPQRVYVELESTPWIWRLDAQGSVHAHTGEPAQWQQGWLDELGWLYAQTDRGFGLVHTQDVGAAAEAIALRNWQLDTLLRADLPQRFSYIPSPQQRATKKRAI